MKDTKQLVLEDWFLEKLHTVQHCFWAQDVIMN